MPKAIVRYNCGHTQTRTYDNRSSFAKDAYLALQAAGFLLDHPCRNCLRAFLTTLGRGELLQLMLAVFDDGRYESLLRDMYRNRKEGSHD